MKVVNGFRDSPMIPLQVEIKIQKFTGLKYSSHQGKSDCRVELPIRLLTDIYH